MAEFPKISVLIPLYRGRNTVKACLESLIKQEGVRLQIILLDNGCPEKTGEWAGFFLGALDNPPEWKLLEEKANIGFAAAMNKMYAESNAPYVCFLNQDVELAGNHLGLLIDALSQNGNYAGVCGTLFRPSDDKSHRIIDTTGHVIFRDRIVRNRGAGNRIGNDKIPYQSGEVFGLSAACSVYKREALENAREPEGPFDPDFFSYFEDIDLDYRIHRAGWTTGYFSEATGTHVHAGSGGRKELAIRIRSYGNRRRIMWKHESLQSLMPDILPILAQDIYGSIRALFTDPAAWFAGPILFLISFPRVLKRRKELDRKYGKDRSWIRKWLKPESERLRGV